MLADENADIRMKAVVKILQARGLPSSKILREFNVPKPLKLVKYNVKRHEYLRGYRVYVYSYYT